MERNNIGRTHTDGSGFTSEDLASQCPKNVIQGKHLSNQISEVLIESFLYFKL